MALAFPPFGVWPLALAAPIPLIWAAVNAQGRPVRGAAWAGLGILFFWAFEHRWLVGVTIPGLILLPPTMAALTAVFVGLLASLRARLSDLPLAVSAPVLWTGVEVFRGEVFMTGYPWFLVGHPLIESPWLAAPGAALGAYAVSMLTAALAGAVCDGLGWSGKAGKRALRLGGIGAGCAVVVWVGLAALGSVGADWHEHGEGDQNRRTLRIAVVQTNVPQDNKIAWTLRERIEDWFRFADLSREAAAAEPDVIVWPEAMFPGGALNDEAIEVARREELLWLPAEDDGLDPLPRDAFANSLFDLQEEIGLPMLVGATAVIGKRVEHLENELVRVRFDARYNSMFLVHGGRTVEPRYDKVSLTPFGEVIPYLWRWPALESLVMDIGAAGMRFDLTPGREPLAIPVPIGESGDTVPVATPICFESTRAGVCRDLVHSGVGEGRAALLVNVSNDGWFGRFAGGREQHLLCSRWRSIELGVPMVRAVNTGISALIDERGRVVAAGPDGAAMPAWTDGVMVVRAPLADPDGRTVFAAWGWVFPWIALAGACVLVLAPLLRPRGVGGRSE